MPYRTLQQRIFVAVWEQQALLRLAGGLLVGLEGLERSLLVRYSTVSLGSVVRCSTSYRSLEESWYLFQSCRDYVVSEDVLCYS